MGKEYFGGPSLTVIFLAIAIYLIIKSPPDPNKPIYIIIALLLLLGVALFKSFRSKNWGTSPDDVYDKQKQKKEALIEVTKNIFNSKKKKPK